MKKEIIKFLVLLMVAAGAGPAGAAIWNWSTTASTNATADPSINWAEGMAPSAVNDSARAMMAGLAAWRNDISGVNSTAGTASAYTLATSEGVNTTPSNGQMLAFIAHLGNNAASTLQVDGGNTYPIWFNGAAVGAGTLVAGTPYRAAFSVANSAWLLEAGYGNPYSISLGGLLASTLAAPPNSNFILPAGQCISTTTYAAYWVALGSPASGSCPGGQFQVIDMRGRIPAGLDNLGGVVANRLNNAGGGASCGSPMQTIGNTCGQQGVNLAANQIPSLSSSGSNLITVTSARNDYVFNALGVVSTSAGLGGANSLLNSTSAGINTVTSSANINITVASPAATQGMPTVQPTLAVSYFLRVL